MSRLCRDRGGGKAPSSSTMQRYNDGNFAAANARLNQLAARLR